MNEFVDLHQHFLWNIDDGAQTMQEAQAMLQLSHQEGIGTIAATPHVYPGLRPFDMAAYLNQLNQARELAAPLGIKILEGAEIHYTTSTLSMLQDGRIPTLGGSEYVLIEFRNNVSWQEVFHAVDKLFRFGYVPVLAHVERYPCFIATPGTALSLRQEADVLFQVNAQSIIRENGIFTRRFFKKMLQQQAVDIISTDAHNSTDRPPVMRAAYEKIAAQYGADYADGIFGFDIGAHYSTRI